MAVYELINNYTCRTRLSNISWFVSRSIICRSLYWSGLHFLIHNFFFPDSKFPCPHVAYSKRICLSTCIRCYYTSDSLWKIWLVESSQSIHNSLWTWHDKCNICCRYYIYHVKFNIWLLSRLECSPQKQNGRTLRFCFWGWIMWEMYNKTIIEFGFSMISWIIKTSCLCYLPKPKVEADNTDLGFDNSWYHAQPHPIFD